MNPVRSLALIAPALALTTLASAGISNMYITNGAGEIYSVDGNTLQATSVAQLQDAGSINDILYIGNGKILANLTFAMATYDLNTGVQETLFNSNGTFGDPSSFVYSSGLARRANGDIYFQVNEFFNPSGIDVYGISYDMQSGGLTQIGGVPFVGALDFYELANGNMIGFNTGNQSILFNPNTGVIEATFDLDVTAVSFVQSFSDLYVVAADGSMYTFDLTDGSTEFYGQITGFERNILGASIASSTAALIPSPASLLALTGGLGMGLRRRR
tara:strand:- start:378864 stop:379679 length:816 start_codon:yes stop_codon:yes gene_type:complete